MLKDSLYFGLHDTEPKGMTPIEPHEARMYNQAGYGIFYSVNAFTGIRRNANLKHINAWFVDIDGNKQEAFWKIYRSPIEPSIVNETKRGLHILFLAQDAIDTNYAEVQSRIVNYFDSDPAVRDLARVLRLPNFYHLKDPNTPFRIKTLVNNKKVHSESRMLRSFRPKVLIRRRCNTCRGTQEPYKEEYSFKWKVQQLDVKRSLLQLNKTPLVEGQEFMFRLHNGGEQIVIDGKSTSSWIDRNGFIGSLSKGGPTIYEWLMWYKGNTVEKLERELPKYIKELV